MQPPRACVKIRCVAKHVDDGGPKRRTGTRKEGKKQAETERDREKRSGTKDNPCS